MNLNRHLVFGRPFSKERVEAGLHLKFLNPPKFIYKYRSFDSKGHSIRNFLNNTVWLGDPNSMNDPFDCSHYFDIAAVARSPAYDSVLEDVHPDELPHMKRIFERHLIAREDEYVQELWTRISIESLELGVFCLQFLDALQFRRT